ncbi:MAG: ABC transporter ATP-binding protein [Candidatus Lokiarchaeota archaeon]|nr:ABC transporter ATP-binding protein [Candidatus Lokiarchaeota archaeon]
MSFPCTTRFRRLVAGRSILDDIIEIRNLVKVFSSKKSNVVALNEINLKIKKGTIFSFLGPNGAGKTTTVRLLSCLLKPTAGEAYVFGKNVLDDPVGIRSRIGVLTENHGMYERMTVKENLDFFSSFYGIDKVAIASRISELLSAFNLTDRADDKVGTLSKGLKQRAALIKTLVHDPELVFLDEPTAGLDPKASVEFRDYIQLLGKQYHKTIFMCTHNLVEAQKLSDLVAIIDKGSIKKIGPPAELEKQLFEAVTFKVVSARPMSGDIALSIADNEGVKASLAGPNELTVFLSKPEEEIMPRIVRKLVHLGVPVVEVARQSHSLEDIYLKLMGGEV